MTPTERPHHAIAALTAALPGVALIEDAALMAAHGGRVTLWADSRAREADPDATPVLHARGAARCCTRGRWTATRRPFADRRRRTRRPDPMAITTDARPIRTPRTAQRVA